MALRKNCRYSEFFWSVFSRIRTEYSEILRVSQYSVQMRENTDQKKSEYRPFLTQCGGSRNSPSIHSAFTSHSCELIGSSTELSVV